MVRFPFDPLSIGTHREAVGPGWPGTSRHDARDWTYARQVSAQGDDWQGWGVCGASRA